MNKTFEKLGFYPADILLPKDQDMTKWAVVACDQFTSEPEYWQAVEEKVGKAPSTLRLILPEAKLNDPDVDAHIADINGAMNRYLAELLGCGVPEVYDRLEDLLNQILPKKPLHAYGVTEADLEEFTRSVMETQGRLMGNNFVPLDAARVLKIYTELY